MLFGCFIRAFHLIFIRRSSRRFRLISIGWPSWRSRLIFIGTASQTTHTNNAQSWLTIISANVKWFGILFYGTTYRFIITLYRSGTNGSVLSSILDEKSHANLALSRHLIYFNSIWTRKTQDTRHKLAKHRWNCTKQVSFLLFFGKFEHRTEKSTPDHLQRGTRNAIQSHSC